MQAHDTVYITPAEWRWVVITGTILVLLAFAPFLWVAATVADPWQFMGVLNNYRDGATYLSKMVQGMEGSWLVHFQHTPESHNGAFIQVIYPALGQIARLISIQPIALFHAVRVVASLLMYMALYHLAATIWTRLRTRRIFFTLMAVGSGLGWFFGALTGDASFPDLSIPEMYPFYSSLVNVHFPLALACLSLLASIFILAYRPGSNSEPSFRNGGLLAALLSLAISLLYPQALLPFGLAAGLCVLVAARQTRRLPLRELRWLLVTILPALPMATYYLAVVMYNPAMAEWHRQNVTLMPSFLSLIVGLGVLLWIALPGIYRAARRLEPDGDRLMLLWMLVIIVLVYLPTGTQRRFAAGLMIPIVYFATRALEDFWFQRINRRWRYRLLVLVVPLVTLSHVFILFSNTRPNLGPFLQRDYAAALQWLKPRTTADDVILAAEQASIWIPAWTGARVVYGHPYETLQADLKWQQVTDWYAGTADCQTLPQTYAVRYVIVGPLERELGGVPCADGLDLVFEQGSVQVFAP